MADIVPSEVLAALAERDLLPPTSTAVLPWKPDPGDGLRDAYRGALVGGAVGDALGRPAEARARSVVIAEYGRLVDYQPWRGWDAGPVGTFTDDTQLTLATAESLIAGGGVLDPADLARRLLDWLPEARGAGRATVAAVDQLAVEPWWRAGTRSAGNGGAMRAAPIGLVHLHDIDLLRRQAALATVVTHADPMAVAGAVAHAWLVASLTAVHPGRLDVNRLIDGLVATLDDLADHGEPERDWQHRPGKTGDPVRLVDRLAEVPAWLDAPVDDALGHFYNGAFILESLPAAVWFFLRRPDDPETVIVEAAMGGRDADTIASMAGAYVGAYLGLDALPERWTGDQLERRDDLVSLADQLYDLAFPPPAATARPRPPEATVGPVPIEDRILGGLLGVHVGDALGAAHEFQPWDTIRRPDDPDWRPRDIVGGGVFDWAPGAATDDTDLTLAVLRTYLTPGGFQLEGAADAMLAWLDAGPRDVGGATSRGLEAYRRSGDPRRAGAGQGSAGNGSLMRCLPTGLIRPDRSTRRRESAEISAITHDDDRCTAACIAYNDLIATLLDGADPATAVDAVIQDADPSVTDAIKAGTDIDIAACATHGGNPFGPSGYVLHSLSLAVAALLDPRPLADVLADLVHLGGDTDTNAAIAGGLLGVREGVAAIPPRWARVVEHGEEIANAVPPIITLRTTG